MTIAAHGTEDTLSPQDLAYWYWLRDVKGVGPSRSQALIEHFGSPEAVFFAGAADYVQVAGVGKDVAKILEASKAQLDAARAAAAREAVIAARIGAAVLTLHDPRYPALLRREPNVAPPLLYVRGSLECLTGQAVAIVGTRHPSAEGVRRARECARRFATESWQIISGLALGIDAAGHQGAIDGGGCTVAVMGCGVDRAYPSENQRLFDSILAHGGAIISEYPFGTAPKGDNLRRRNRITVALSRAVLIAECPEGSGTLIAATDAFEQVKPVFAFPFPDGRQSARGSQRLLEDGDARVFDPEAAPAQFAQALVGYADTRVAVLFDLDGVLGDMSRLTRNALACAAGVVDGTKPDKNALARVQHLSPRAALKQLSSGPIERLTTAYEAYWNKNLAKDITALPAVRTLLAKLITQRFPIGLVTSRNRAQTLDVLSALDMSGLFEVIVTWGDTTQHKPNPEPLQHALARLGPQAATVYVGDRPSDVTAAKYAGVAAAAALWHLEDAEAQELRSAGPDYVVEQPSELYDLVLKLKRQCWAGKAPGQTPASRQQPRSAF